MSIANKISNLVGIYNSLSFPVLGLLQVRSGKSYLINDAFKKTFLEEHNKNIHDEIIKNQLLRIQSNPLIHHKGNIYKVDEFDLAQGIKYYFYSFSSQSVSHSFLWLKHDLLNILNPIMGFSDVLIDSDEISKDDKVLVHKIKYNSEKIFQQIQKLAFLQDLENKNYQFENTYELVDFINELTSQLKANHLFDKISKPIISHSGKVNARIIQADFRSNLEEHLEYLSNFQDIKEIKIQSVFYNYEFRIKLQIINCKPPLSYVEMIKDVDMFLKECKPIKKLQINALSYLILNEICDTFGASIVQKLKDNDVIIELFLPSLTKESKINKDHSDVQKYQAEILQEDIFKNIPKELLNKISSLCKAFDGLLILDDWQEFSNRLKRLNDGYDNKDIDTIIEEINKGITTFDIEKLRGLYYKLQQTVK